MTAADAYRDAWLAEMWAPVREHRSTPEERADAAARNVQLTDRFGDDGRQLRVAS